MLCVDGYAIVDHPLFMVTIVIGWIKYCIVIYMSKMDKGAKDKLAGSPGENGGG
jgi:hypothetical protein